jgi:hypothetical protein
MLLYNHITAKHEPPLHIALAYPGFPSICYSNPHFETTVLRAKLAALGFREIEDLNPALIREPYFTNRGASSPDRGGHIVRAATV